MNNNWHIRNEISKRKSIKCYYCDPNCPITYNKIMVGTNDPSL